MNGCSDQTTQTQSMLDCQKYDGTWKGVISDSGSLEVTREVNGEYVVTHNPFTAQYDFEMTIKGSEGYSSAGYDPICIFLITHVKASHPIFDCQQGCTPVQASRENTFASMMSTDKDGNGAIDIVFENRASILMFSEDGNIKINPEGNRMELYIPENVENWKTIGATYGRGQTIETDNCYKMGNAMCNIEYLNKNTIILNKIS